MERRRGSLRKGERGGAGTIARAVEDEADVAPGDLDAVGVGHELLSPVDHAVALGVDARQASGFRW
jgi:hypothetical protein